MPCAIPRYSVNVPIVTASDGRPRRVTRNPLNAPRNAPRTIAAAIAGQIGQPCLNSSAIRTPVRPRIDATERSISPVITSRVSGSAMIATSPTFRQMKKRFVDWRKYGETEAPYAIVAASRTTSSASQRTRNPKWLQFEEPSAASTGGSLLGTSATDPPPGAERGRDANGDQAVERDRGEQESARESLAPERGDIDDDERAVDRVQQEGAERRTENRAAPPDDRDPAHDH